MNSYKLELSDTTQNGNFTEGNAITLEATYKKNDIAVDLSTAQIETRIASRDGGSIIITNGSHGGANKANGVVEIAISATVSAKVREGRKIWIASKVTIGSDVQTYWGQIDEVRNSIK